MTRARQQDFLELLTSASNGSFIPGECCNISLEQLRTTVVEQDERRTSGERDKPCFVDKMPDNRRLWQRVWKFVRG